MNDDTHDPDLQPVEAIYDALDRGEPERALELARQSRPAEDDDPVVRFLGGVALLELDRPEEAVDELARASALDPEDAEFRANLAMALFRCCRFDKAGAAAADALAASKDLPDAHYVLGMTREREGRFDEAENCFAEASRIDPEAFPAPHRLEDAEFERQLAKAREWLPEEFRKRLDEVVVTIEPLPSEAILLEEDPPLDPELLGLFVGISLAERSSFSVGGELPPRILLFKRNLERAYPDPDALTREIARTLHHELGHYLGLDESELAAIDLD